MSPKSDRSNATAPSFPPEKVWITQETAEYGGETEPYLSINDPNDLSPGAVCYVPEHMVAQARAEGALEALEAARAASDEYCYAHNIKYRLDVMIKQARQLRKGTTDE